MINKKKIISENVENIAPYDVEGTLAQLNDKVQDLIAKYGPSTTIWWDPNFYYAYDPNPSPRFSVQRSREETDEEQEKRLKKEKEDKQTREARDRAEYERLKKVLGEK